MDKRRHIRKAKLLSSSGDESSTEEEEETESDDTSPEEETSSEEESEDDEESEESDDDDDTESSESTSSAYSSTSSEGPKKRLNAGNTKKQGQRQSLDSPLRVRRQNAPGARKERLLHNSVDEVPTKRSDSSNSSPRYVAKKSKKKGQIGSTKKKGKQKKKQSKKASDSKAQTNKTAKNGTKATKKKRKKPNKKSNGKGEEEEDEREAEQEKQGKRSLLPPGNKRLSKNMATSGTSEEGSSIGSSKWDDLLKRGFNGLMKESKSSNGKGEKKQGRERNSTNESKRKMNKSKGSDRDGTEGSGGGDEEEKQNILDRKGKRKDSKDVKKKEKEDKTNYLKVNKRKRKDNAFSRVYKVQDIGDQDGGHIGAIWAIAFSPDGVYLATGGSDATVRVWPMAPIVAAGGEDEEDEEGRVTQVLNVSRRHEFKGHAADILDLSWSTNNFLVSASMDNTVKLWHISCETSVASFRHTDFVTTVAFHPSNNKTFLSGGLDRRVCIWDLSQKRVAHDILVEDMVTAAAFVSSATVDQLIVVGTDSGKLLFFDTDGERASHSPSSRGELRLVKEINVNSSRLKKGKRITGISVSSDGRYILVTSNDSLIRLYENGSFDLLCTYTGSLNKDFLVAAQWSKTNDYVISGSEEPHVHIWEAKRESSKKERMKPSFSFPTTHGAMCPVARFAPRSVGLPGEVIVTGGLDGRLQVFHCLPEGD